MADRDLDEWRNLIFPIITSRVYSPWALRHLPRQPVPNDLPAELGPSIFTFQDAFEDLLAVTSGKELPDISSRYQQRKLLRDMFPSGEPMSFWLRRLQSQSLWPSSRSSPLRGRGDSAVTTFHDNELHENPAGVPWPSARDHGDGTRVAATLLEQIGNAFRQQGALEERARAASPDSTDKAQQEREPHSFEELVSDVASKYKETVSSWEKFAKMILKDAKVESSDQFHMERHDDTENDALTTEQEYIDRFGYSHKTVTRRILDSYGNEVGSEVRVTIRPAAERLNNESNESAEAKNPPDTEKSGTGSKWFWK
ncbi:uncharacterized protein UV8b_06301 [Ustilaginoidea virens]|uniref:Uncharacterized protein n=1 Tax=Ustilaginoidea virens TaxID=1159556 RepID=A0A063BZA7_USTVR|nr:uncharacterized protein UV8b_06301 [Ustilaginoidea virens]QUC22060.1 hypothetical protein UV8b_06301 [Ustilaginoidea virens]GAO18206.1 hypothetical protein UVI_02022730 [Ustilaginoidea virens]